MNNEVNLDDFEKRMNELKLRLATALMDKNKQDIEYYSRLLYMHKKSFNSETNKKLLELLKKR